MKNIFDLKRFGNVLVYDMDRAYRSYGLSALIAGLFPAVVFIFYQFFSLIFAQSFCAMPSAMKVTAVLCSLAIFLVSSPSKIYGNLTEKRSGSDWLLIPASSFEKFLAMVVVLCVVLPLVFTVLFLGSDLLLSVLFPDSYGGATYMDAVRNAFVFLSDGTEEVDFTMACAFIPWLSWCQIILVFALGALCFKERKAAKTILVLIAVSMLLGSLTATIAQHTDLFDDLGNWFMEHRDSITSGKVQFIFNAAINLNYLLVNGLLLFGIYYRIRTMKH